MMSDYLIYFYQMQIEIKLQAQNGPTLKLSHFTTSWLQFLESTHSCNRNNVKKVCFCEFFFNTPHGPSDFKETPSLTVHKQIPLSWSVYVWRVKLKIKVPAFSACMNHLNHCPFVLSTVTWPSVPRLRLKDYNANTNMYPCVLVHIIKQRRWLFSNSSSIKYIYIYI